MNNHHLPDDKRYASVQSLLALGANANYQVYKRIADHYVVEHTPLNRLMMISFCNNKMEIATLLVSAGAFVSISDLTGDCMSPYTPMNQKFVRFLTIEKQKQDHTVKSALSAHVAVLPLVEVIFGYIDHE